MSRSENCALQSMGHWQSGVTEAASLPGVQTSIEDKESGHLLSAVNCFFMCQVLTQPCRQA